MFNESFDDLDFASVNLPNLPRDYSEDFSSDFISQPLISLDFNLDYGGDFDD